MLYVDNPDDKNENYVYKKCVLLNEKTFEIIDDNRRGEKPEKIYIEFDYNFREDKPWEIVPYGYFICDKEISKVVQLFNLKGYRTTFCCSGHWEWSFVTDNRDNNEMIINSPYSAPYVSLSFKNFEKYADKLLTLPNYFSVEIDTFIDDLEKKYVKNNPDKAGYLIGEGQSTQITFRSNMVRYSDLCRMITTKGEFEICRKHVLNGLLKWVKSLPDLNK